MEGADAGALLFAGPGLTGFLSLAMGTPKAIIQRGISAERISGPASSGKVKGKKKAHRSGKQRWRRDLTYERKERVPKPGRVLPKGYENRKGNLSA